MYLLVALLFWLVSFRPVMAQYAIWDTPVVYYDFENPNSVNIKDKMGNNNITTYDSGTSLPISVVSKNNSWGLKFNGSSNYAMALDSASFSQTGSFSVEAWVKITSIGTTGSFQTILSKWDETTDQRTFRLTINTDTDNRAWPQFQVSTDGTSGNIKTVIGQTQILPNQWYLFQGYYKSHSAGWLIIMTVRENFYKEARE